MAGNGHDSLKKWDIIKEQLISLYICTKTTKGYDDLKKILKEDIPLKSLNSQVLSLICHFLLGIIDIEERDKLIKWPLINIQTNTKFRKGLSTMVTNFQERFPWANIKKLPESYFLNPHGCQKKVVDFILRLSNLAIHLILNDPELLIMHSGQDVSSKEIEFMTEVIQKATVLEEENMNKNVFPIQEFEEVKDSITNKCIALRQINDETEQSLNNLLKCAIKEGFIKPQKDGLDGLKVVADEKLSELKKMNDEFRKYYNASEELLKKLKALKHPVTLTAQDFGCTGSPDLTSETLRVCENLLQLHQNIVNKMATREEEDMLYEELLKLKNVLLEENEAFKSVAIDKVLEESSAELIKINHES